MRRLSPKLFNVVSIVGFFFILNAMGQLSVTITRLTPFLALWLPNGIIATALILKHYKKWPLILLIAIMANLITGLTTGFDIYATFSYILVNVIEVTSIAYICKRYKIKQNFQNNLKSAITLLILCTSIIPVVSASLHTLLFSMYPGPLSSRWLKYFASHSLGLGIIIPCLLSITPENLQEIKSRLLNVIFLLLLVGVITYYSALHLPYPFIYISLPLIITAIYSNLLLTMCASLLSSTAFIYLILAKYYVPTAADNIGNFPMIVFPLIIETMPPYIIAVIIRNMRLKQSQLVLSENFFRNAMMYSSIGMALVSTSGKWLRVNNALCNILGYSESELLTLSFQEITHPDDLAQDIIHLNKLLQHEIDSYHTEKRYIKKNGQHVWIRLDISIVKNQNNLNEYFVAQIQDIDKKRQDDAELKRNADDLKKLSAKLHDEKELLENILNGSQHAIIVTNPSGKIIIFNPAAEKLLGYSAHEALHKLTPLSFHDATEIANHAKKIAPLINKQIANDFEALIAKLEIAEEDLDEWTYVKKNGDKVPVLLSISALYDVQHTIIGYMGIAQDISEQKKLDALKKDFISTVSHELRTPLTSIRGSLGLILSDKFNQELSDKSRNLLEIAYKNCKRLIFLINDILDIEKIEAGQMRFEFENIKLNEFIYQCRDLNLAYAEQYKVSIKIIEPIGDFEIYADFDRLMQVMTNLISNAAKFSKPDASIDIKTIATDQRTVRISVTDYGVGIPPEFRTKIFGKFSQVDSSSTKVKGGTGLGLNISRAIIEKLGGQINFYSQLNVGTTFYIDLPIITQQSEQTKTNSAHPKVLVIADDSLHLDHDPYIDFDVTENLDLASKYIYRNDYAAIAMDINKNLENKLLFIERIKVHQLTKHIPLIIIASTEPAGEIKQRINSLAITDWLIKPLDTDRLITSIKKLSSQHNLPTILHVEDDNDVADVINYALRGEANILHAATLEKAKQLLMAKAIQLIILDIMLPDGLGTELLPDIQAKSIPVIIFSAKEVDATIHQSVHTTLVKSKNSETNVVDAIRKVINQVKS